MAVFVLDRRGKPLMPCSEKRARLLLARGRARVHRVVPFVIRLVDRAGATAAVQPVRIKLDPGSKTTGLALMRVEIEHITPRCCGGSDRVTNLTLACHPCNQAKGNRNCVGVVEGVTGWAAPVLAIRCTGRGAYQRTRVTKHGFPRGYLMRHKQVRGFQTGDLVRAAVASGKRAGVHHGRVAVRASGGFNIQTSQGVVQGVGHCHCRVIQRNDGYGYTQVRTAALPSPAIPPRPAGRGFLWRMG